MSAQVRQNVTRQVRRHGVRRAGCRGRTAVAPGACRTGWAGLRTAFADDDPTGLVQAARPAEIGVVRRRQDESQSAARPVPPLPPLAPTPQSSRRSVTDGCLVNPGPVDVAAVRDVPADDRDVPADDRGVPVRAWHVRAPDLRSVSRVPVTRLLPRAPAPRADGGRTPSVQAGDVVEMSTGGERRRRPGRDPAPP